MKLFRMLFTFTLGLLLSCQLLHAQSAAVTKAVDAFDIATDLKAMLEALATVEPVAFDSLPKNRRGDVNSVGYWSMKNLNWPPLPANFYGLDVWPLGDGHFVLDDRKIDYDALNASTKAGSRQMRTAFSPSGGGGGYSPFVLYSTNDLWLEIVNVDTTNQFADLLLHNTQGDASYFYQLSSKTNLLQPGWKLGSVVYGDPGTNVTAFNGEFIGQNPMMFFRAQSAEWNVGVGSSDNAVEPQGSAPGLNGYFYVSGGSVSGVTNNLTVYYRLSGTASNGVDYTLLNGVITVTNNDSTRIDIEPIADALMEVSETVTLTLIPTNTYLINIGNETATIQLFDSSTTLSLHSIADAVEPDGPPGIPAKHGLIQVSRDDLRGLYTNLAVNYLISGTASNGVDYSLLTGTIFFAPDDNTTNIDIAPLLDSVPEGLESVTVKLYPTNAYVVNHSASNATIFISDSSTTVSLSVISNSAIEPDGPPGAAAVPASFRVHRDDTRGIYTNLAVFYAVSGTASNGVDFVLSGTIYFAPNMTDTNIIVTPLADVVLEGVETVTLTLLNNATNGYFINTNSQAGTATINDTTTTIKVNVLSTNAIEPDGPPGAAAVSAVFQVHRDDTRGIFTNLAVGYVVSGAASNGVDFALLSGTVNFAPGMTDTNIFVTPLADTLIEGLQTVTLTLVNATTNKYFVNPTNAVSTVLIGDSTTTLSISNISNSTEPGFGTNAGQTGIVRVSRVDSRNIFNSLTVQYSLSGTAGNGVDYSNLTGTVSFLPNATSTNIFIAPLADSLIESVETVILTLVPNATNPDSYLISSNASTATNTITDAQYFQTVTNLTTAIGMDFYAPSNYLIVSSTTTGGFLRIYTNAVVSNGIAITTNLVMTNWTGINNLLDEVKLATVKTTANGFTNGEMFFGNNAVTKIGRLSADGTVSNLNFATLTNDTYIRGSLYVDQSGSFGGDLIAVTGNLPGNGGGVWRVNSNGNSSKLTNIVSVNPHLEGVITLTNDVQKWGPWAGKIITGAESEVPPKIYAVSTNGTFTTFQMGIGSEDFDLIPTNQDLYCAFELNGGGAKILKVSRSYFAPYVGDLLITQSGDGNLGVTPTLFIVHWNSSTTNFGIVSIPTSGGVFEHVTFAPINLPAN